MKLAMREIKFRAWHKSWIKGIMDYNPRAWIEDGEINSSFKEKDIVFMQFTGLKSKSGVDIYEGDIVKYDDYSMKGNLINVLFDIELGCWHKAREYRYGEILGNIYENPELLK